MARQKAAKTRRRTRGEGSIYEKTRSWKTRDGETHEKKMWVAAISEGIDPKDGARRRKFFYGNTATEAREARDRYLAKVGKDVPEPEERDTITVAEYAEHFIKHAKRHARATTARSYEQTLRLHLLPQLGAIPLQKLAAEQIKPVYEKLSLSVSRSMAARSHVVLRAMLNLAREERLIDASPLDAIRKAIPRHRRPRIEALTEKQVAKLLKAVKGDRLEALFVVAVTTGMRQGELFALRWNDVDLARRTIYVQRSAQEVNGEIEFVEPKTDLSRRRISLSKLAVDALKQRREIAKRERHGSELVFPSPRGDAQRKSNFIRRVWEPLRVAAGIPGTRFHDLRHTAASLLLAEGVNPKVVQEMLGHASIRLTLDTYSHLIPTMQAGAADAFDRLLARRGGH